MTKTTIPEHPASYCRISEDRLATELGVERQQRENDERAARAGWSRPRLFVDNDISAYSGRTRPEYLKLVQAITSNEVDGLVVWHVDRLYRRPTELENLIDLLDSRPSFPILTVTAGTIDLSTASGRMVARMLVNVSRYESEHRSERIRSKHRELAQAGKQAGGGTRPFGFNEDRLTINESEAQYVRYAASSVSAGSTLRSISAEWNHDGVSTVTGAKWSPQVLKGLLTSPRIAGFREHRGEIVAKACWPGIIDRESHERLRVILEDPRRKTRRRPASRYLMTGGLARCGLCGAALVARPRGDGRRCYVCATGPGFSGCGKIRALSDPLEEFVTLAVLAAVDTPALAEQLAQRTEAPDDAVAEITAVETRLTQLANLFAEGSIGELEWLTARRRLDERLEAATSRLSTSTANEAIHPFLGRHGALAEAWPNLHLDRRRAILAAVVDRVVLRPAVRGRNTFDPDRIEVVWRW